MCHVKSLTISSLVHFSFPSSGVNFPTTTGGLVVKEANPFKMLFSVDFFFCFLLSSFYIYIYVTTFYSVVCIYNAQTYLQYTNTDTPFRGYVGYCESHFRSIRRAINRTAEGYKFRPEKKAITKL